MKTEKPQNPPIPREIEARITSRSGDQETVIRRSNKIRRLLRLGRYRIGFGAWIIRATHTN